MANPLAGLFDSLMEPISKLTGTDRLAGMIGAIARTLFDGKMWRSLGWLLLGFVFVWIGIVLLLRKPIEQAAGVAVKAAML